MNGGTLLMATQSPRSGQKDYDPSRSEPSRRSKKRKVITSANNPFNADDYEDDGKGGLSREARAFSIPQAQPYGETTSRQFTGEDRTNCLYQYSIVLEKRDAMLGSDVPWSDKEKSLFDALDASRLFEPDYIQKYFSSLKNLELCFRLAKAMPVELARKRVYNLPKTTNIDIAELVEVRLYELIAFKELLGPDDVEMPPTASSTKIQACFFKVTESSAYLSDRAAFRLAYKVLRAEVARFQSVLRSSPEPMTEKQILMYFSPPPPNVESM